MMRNIVLTLDSLATCEGHFGANREMFEAPWLFISLPSKKQQLWVSQVCAFLGFAKLGAGVWLWPVPRMLLGAGFRRGRRLRGLEVVVGKTRPACFCSGVLWKGATARGWLSLSVTRRSGYPPVVQGQKRKGPNRFALWPSGPLLFFGSFENCFVMNSQTPASDFQNNDHGLLL